MEQNGRDIALSIRGLFKVFADEDGQGLNLAVDGQSKDEIQEATGAVVGLRDINIDVARGELFVVMGLSGCGKSTLVRCINRLIEPSLGEVWLNGHEITSMDADELRDVRRRDLAMVFQHFGLMPHRNVLDNVVLPLEVAGVAKLERRERAATALNLVGLGDWTASLPSQLSGGMKQRVGLARGLAMETPVLLMDEPFSALDPVIRRDLQDELLALQESVHKTIVFITHDLNEAVRVGDRIAIMRDGEVVQVGAPNDVVLNPADSFVREFTRDVRLHGMVTAASIMDSEFESIDGATPIASAIEIMQDSALSMTCCVDAGGKYLGALDLARALKARSEGAQEIEQAQLYVGDAVPARHSARRSRPRRTACAAPVGCAGRRWPARRRHPARPPRPRHGLRRSRRRRHNGERADAMSDGALPPAMPSRHLLALILSGANRPLAGHWWVAPAMIVVIGLGFVLSYFLVADEFPFDVGRDVGRRIDIWLDWLKDNFSPVFQAIKNVIVWFLISLEDMMLWLTWPALIGAIALTSWAAGLIPDGAVLGVLAAAARDLRPLGLHR